MSFPTSWLGGYPNFAYSGFTTILPRAAGRFSILEIKAPIDRIVYIDSVTIIHGCDVGLLRLNDSIIDQDLANHGVDAGLNRVQVVPPPFGGGLLDPTAEIDSGTTTFDPSGVGFIVAAHQRMPPVSDAQVREFSPERFTVPALVPERTIGAAIALATDEEVKIEIRWFEKNVPSSSVAST